MTTTQTTTFDELPISDDVWRWSTGDDESAPWLLRWKRTDQVMRHLCFVEESGDSLFPYQCQPHGDTSLEVESTTAVPLASVDWRNTEAATRIGLFESLGRLISGLHNLSAPAGFGDAVIGDPYRTFNAFMASEFAELGRRMDSLDDEELYHSAVASMATLRHELSAFHPHGKSTWTAGRLSPNSIAVDQSPLRAEAIVDLGAAALRPFEYDLATLSIHGLILDDPLADRAFWKGYGAAVTCDLKRRISYFERLIELEHLLHLPAFLDRAATGDDDVAERHRATEAQPMVDTAPHE